MAKFKNWFLTQEMLSPGGGNTELPAPNGEVIAKDSLRTGAGAFPTYGNDNPPSRGKNPLEKYLPPHSIITKKQMNKKMRKQMKKR